MEKKILMCTECKRIFVLGGVESGVRFANHSHLYGKSFLKFSKRDESWAVLFAVMPLSEKNSEMKFKTSERKRGLRIGNCRASPHKIFASQNGTRGVVVKKYGLDMVEE